VYRLSHLPLVALHFHMGRNKKKKREVEEVRICCFYCDRQFKDEEILIDHQRAKHFRCEVCNKKLSTAKGLATHCYQVHRLEVTSVPNAKEGNDSIELDIYGMAGVDEALVALGRAPEEPEEKVAKVEHPSSQPAPALSQAPQIPLPAIRPVSPYIHPGYPYPPPHHGYGYPSPAPLLYGGHMPWPVRPGRPGQPPPWPGQNATAAWSHPPERPGLPANSGAVRPSGLPPQQTPLFPVVSGDLNAGGVLPLGAPSISQPSETISAEELNPLSDGLVWKDTDLSMEERRASLPKYTSESI